MGLPVRSPATRSCVLSAPSASKQATATRRTTATRAGSAPMRRCASAAQTCRSACREPTASALGRAIHSFPFSAQLQPFLSLTPLRNPLNVLKLSRQGNDCKALALGTTSPATSALHIRPARRSASPWTTCPSAAAISASPHTPTTYARAPAWNCARWARRAHALDRPQP